MLFAVFLSLSLLSLCLLLHYHQHFTLCSKKQSNSQSPTSVTESESTATYQKNFCKLLQPIDDFDFFPPSFFYYLLFKIVLCLFIAAVYIIQNTSTSYKDLLFGYSLETLKYSKHDWFESSSVHLSDSHNIFIDIIDYILIYSVMFLSLWESLFSFYKFYTTLFVVVKCKIISTQTVLSKFMIYAILFCIVLIAQIHFYYYLYPLILTLHFVFNTYCTFRFASMLISKYHDFLEHDGLDNEENMKVLQSVYFMRRTSIICCILQLSYLGLFTIFHSINTLIYLPVIWCLCACIHTLNFVRNRRFIQYKIFAFKQKCQVYLKHTKTHRNEAAKDMPPLGDKDSIPIKKIVVCDTPSVQTVNPEGKAKLPPLTPDPSIADTQTYPDTHSDVPTVTSTFSAMTILMSEKSASSMAKISCDSHTDAQATLSVPKLNQNKALQLLGVSKKRARRAHGPHGAHGFHQKSVSDAFYAKSGGISVATHSNTLAPQIPMASFTQSRSYDPTPQNEFKRSISSIKSSYDYGTDDEDKDYEDDSRADNIQAPIELKLEIHHSEPLHVEVEEEDVIQSLDLFAKYGFCSRDTIKSMYKLRSHHNKINHMKFQQTR